MLFTGFFVLATCKRNDSMTRMSKNDVYLSQQAV